MAWVQGKPKMVSERYLGSAADIAAAFDAHEAAITRERTRHLAFGDVAAGWGMLERLGVVALIDEVVGARRADPRSHPAARRASSWRRVFCSRVDTPAYPIRMPVIVSETTDSPW